VVATWIGNDEFRLERTCLQVEAVEGGSEEVGERKGLTHMLHNMIRTQGALRQQRRAREEGFVP
jgi:hypothetical protein